MPTEVRKRSIYPFIIVLLVGVLACSAVQTATQAPAQTPATAVVPSEAPAANSGANTAAAPTEAQQEAQPSAAFDTLLGELQDKGYISSTAGTFYTLEDYSEESAKLNWYSPTVYLDDVENFVFSGHLNWATASATHDDSGCGVVFGLSSDGADQYAAFLTDSRIYFMRSTAAMGNYAAEVGKTKGTGRVNFANPAEADFALAVNGKSAYVYVNQQFIGQYTLSNDQFTRGSFGLALLSGTNKDFGTRCEMKNLELLVIE